jgi:hypothetical protein
MGGAGKSQIALKFAEEYEEQCIQALMKHSLSGLCSDIQLLIFYNVLVYKEILARSHK